MEETDHVKIIDINKCFPYTENVTRVGQKLRVSAETVSARWAPMRVGQKLIFLSSLFPLNKDDFGTNLTFMSESNPYYLTAFFAVPGTK